ncbi:HepT-like ribonuclease domain-containing protein [Neorhizobium sp. NPDC001467]|uniref:HepT-like ribonuclease domain-containing protein n=1 Tax=Neorhizobium sp. NPDC001467 TaxID=3390595 RepID=UPI003CFF83E9
MPSKRPLTRMRDIVENGTAVLDYTKGMEFETYTSTNLVKDATERCFTRISEASVKLGVTAEELFPDHDWLAMRHLGNVLRHDYNNVLDTIIWTIRNDRLPPLIAELQAFLARYPDDQETL